MKTLCFYFFLIVYLVLTNASITPRCSSDTIQSAYDNKTCYLFVNNSKTFDEAESFCKTKNGNLAAVYNIFASIFISSTALKEFGIFNTFWIGGTMKTVKMNAASTINVWGWTKDNGLMTFSDWDPTSTTTGNCTGVQLDTLWSAIDCNLKNPFVCEIPADFSYCDNGWTYFDLTNSCYRKFAFFSRINQPAAENSCIQKGGHLASIHTVEENQFIGNLTSIGWRGDGFASVFWIGAQRNDNSDNWYWVDKSRFDFSNWGGVFTNDFCSSFWPDWTGNENTKPLEWYSYVCSVGLNGYLCKKSPNVEPVCNN